MRFVGSPSPPLLGERVGVRGWLARVGDEFAVLGVAYPPRPAPLRKPPRNVNRAGLLECLAQRRMEWRWGGQ